MARKKNIWVSPRPDGKWKVKREGASRASRVKGRKTDAARIARRMAKREGVEVIIQGQDGKIQQKDSYGHDPIPA